MVHIRHDTYHRSEFVKQLPRLLCLQDMTNRTEDLPTTEQLNRIAAPTLMVPGAQNLIGDVPETHKLAEHVPHSRLEIFAEYGHWPQHEHTARFNALHLDFRREERA